MARRNETSNALVEVRTVLNRAKTARDNIVWESYDGNIIQDEASWIETWGNCTMPDWYPNSASGVHDYDRDAQDMYDALTSAIDSMERWAGKKKRKSR